MGISNATSYHDDSKDALPYASTRMDKMQVTYAVLASLKAPLAAAADTTQRLSTEKQKSPN